MGEIQTVIKAIPWPFMQQALITSLFALLAEFVWLFSFQCHCRAAAVGGIWQVGEAGLCCH